MEQFDENVIFRDEHGNVIDRTRLRQMAWEESLKGWMIKVSQDIVDLKQGLKLLLDKTPSGHGSGGTGKCSECAHCNPELLNDAKSLDFDKVNNEEGLNVLESKLDADSEFKNKLMNFCFNAIGLTRPAEEIQTCCLELSRVLFDKAFWATVTWTGSKDKFALNAHVTILELLTASRQTIILPAFSKLVPRIERNN